MISSYHSKNFFTSWSLYKSKPCPPPLRLFPTRYVASYRQKKVRPIPFVKINSFIHSVEMGIGYNAAEFLLFCLYLYIAI